MTIVEPRPSLNSRFAAAARGACRPPLAPAFVSGPVTTSTSDQAIALTAVDTFDLNSSGIGMYPLSPGFDRRR